VAKVHQPFVRLAMCRFQPYADPALGVSISKIVRADFLQLPSERMLQISQVSGSGTAALAPYSVVVGGPETPNKTYPTLGSATETVAFIEQQSKAFTGQVMAGWEPVSLGGTSVQGVSTFTTLSPIDPTSADQVRWMGGTLLPPTLDTSRYNYRIVAEQYEIFDTGVPGIGAGRKLMYSDWISIP
jgi:hypothetical protein